MLTLDSKPRPQASVQGRQLENEAVLVLPEKGEVKVLNEVGARIWALTDGQHSVRQIAATVSAEYQVDRSVAEADTLEFMAQLVVKGLVASYE